MLYELGKLESQMATEQANVRYRRCLKACEGDEAKIKNLISIADHAEHIKAEWVACLALGINTPRKRIKDGEIAWWVRCWTHPQAPLLVMADEEVNKILLYVRLHDARHAEVPGWTTVNQAKQLGTKVKAGDSEAFAVDDKDLFPLEDFPYDCVGLPWFAQPAKEDL